MDRVKLNRPRFILADDTQKRYVTAPGESYSNDQIARQQIEEENIRQARESASQHVPQELFGEIGSMTDQDWITHNEGVVQEEQQRFQKIKKMLGE